MLRLRSPFVLAAALTVAAVLPALGLAGPPVVQEHVNFTSDPYADSLCGIQGSAVDDVVAQFSLYESGATLERLNVTTLFTSTATGKSLEIRSVGARRGSAPIDNGDGTYSIIVTNTGPSANFKLPNGPMVWIDVGLVEFLVTFDQATGDFLSFEVLRISGPREPGCDAIVAVLS